MKDIVKLCLSLGFFCALSGIALAFVNDITAEPCRRAEEAERTSKLKLVLPAETVETQLDESTEGVQFFRAFDAEGKCSPTPPGCQQRFWRELRSWRDFPPKARFSGFSQRASETPALAPSH